MRQEDSKLFELIQTLSKEEKRYFKLYLKNIGRDQTNYEKLFDAIAAQSKCDDEELKKKFAKENFSKQLSVTKNLLYKLILKTLQNYHADSDTNSVLLNLIAQADLLVSKNLYAQAKELLDKAKEIAQTHEKMQLLPMILERLMDLEIIFFTFKEIDEPLLLAQCEEFSAALQGQVILANIKKTTYQVLYHTNKTFAIPQIADFFETQLKNIGLRLEAADIQKMPVAALELLRTKGVLLAVLSRPEESGQTYLEILDLLDKYPYLYKDNVKMYFNFLQNASYNYMFYFDKSVYLKINQKIDAFMRLGYEISWQSRFGMLGFQLTQSIIEQQAANAGEILETAQAFLTNNQPKLNAKVLLCTRYTMGIAYLLRKEYDKALESFEWVIEEKSDLMPRLQILARHFRLLIYFVRQETLLLPYAARSVYRYLEKRELLYDFDRAWLNFLKRVMDKIDKKNIYDSFVAFRNDVQEIMNNKNRKPNESLDIFPYLYWLDMFLNE